MTGPHRVGLVVAGAGARGAYEAGALSVLAPAMAADGHPPTVLVGTSAGAINVVALAALADDGWRKATDAVVEMWSDVSLSDVTDVLPSLAADVPRYTGQLFGLPTRLTSLLDTSRERDALAARLHLDRVHRNVGSGLIDAVAVATTLTSTGETVVFVEKRPSVPLPPRDDTRNITYVATELTVEHVLASSAVPVAFRPVEIEGPSAVAGWHLDGGVRLNVPLKPAIKLGCRRLGVVSTHPGGWPMGPLPMPDASPDVFRAAALTLQAVLNDRMVEDLHTLSKINGLAARASGEPDAHEIEFLFVGPPNDQAGRLGQLANEVAAEQYAGLRGVGHPGAWLLDHLIGGDQTDHGELLSFLLFESPFTTQAATLGAEHAAAALTAPRRAVAAKGTAKAAAAPWRTQLA